MSTDREVLLVLVQAIEAGGEAFRPRCVSTALRAARMHLRATSPHDCAAEVERASAAAYAAGQARQAGAAP